MLDLRSFNRFLLSSLALLGLSLSSANAATVLTNPGQFSGSETLLTFQGAGTNNGDPVSNFGGVSFALSNGDAAYFVVDGSARQFGPAEASAIDNFFGVPAAPNPDLTMTFSSLVNRVGFEMRTNFNDNIAVTMSLSAGGSIVDTHTFTTLGPNLFFFYAFETAVLFDELIIDVDETVNGAFRLDNLRYEVNPIPVPAAVWLFGTALFGLLGFGRRKKAA